MSMLEAPENTLLVKLAVLGWLVSCYKCTDISSCQPRCTVSNESRSSYETDQGPNQSLLIHCILDAPSFSSCLLNVSEVISTRSSIRKRLFSDFHIRIQCEAETNLVIRATTDSVPKNNPEMRLEFTGPCMIPWTEIEKFENAINLQHLMLQNGSEIAKHEYSSPGTLEGISNITSVYFKAFDFPYVQLHRFPMRTRELKQVVWNKMATASFSSYNLRTIPVEGLKVIMPNLQSLNLDENLLTKPPTFPWSSKTLRLPRQHTKNKNNHKFDFEHQIEADIHTRSFILDRNDIANLSTHEFAGFLHHLSLRSNTLEVVGQTCFSNLTGILSIDLSQNRLRQLPKGLFQGLHSLHELHLDRNKLDYLSPSIFHGLVNLTKLRLSKNSLRELDPGIFQGLHALLELHLTYNDIDLLSPNIFRDLVNLKILSLSTNELREFPPGLFQGLHSLLELHLDGNRLYHLSPNTFHNLVNLKKLNLNGNNFRELPTELFQGLHSLLELCLDYNYFLDLPPNIFHGLANLSKLSLHQSNLLELDPNIFQGLHSLLELSVEHTYIKSLPSNIFQGLRNLKQLRLSRNKLRELPRGIFQGLQSLHELQLDRNNIHQLSPDAFQDLVNLERIYLNNNQLKEIPVWTLLSKNLKLVNLSDNMITFTKFGDLLDSVDANAFRNYHRHTWGPKDRKTVLNLRNNKIETLNIKGFSKTKLDKLYSILRVHNFDLTGNPLICSCVFLNTGAWLGKLMQSENGAINETDFDTWKCSEPSDIKNNLLIQVPEERCPVQHSENCPKNCNCTSFLANNTFIVDCRERNLAKLPKQLPRGLLELHFEKNQIEAISSSAFLGNVTGLYLSHNNIQRLGASSLRGLTRIRNLYLDNNKLKELPTAIQNVPFTRLDIHNNIFKCDCNAKWMKYWLKNVTDRIIAVNNTQCHVNTTLASGNLITEVQDSDFKCNDPKPTDTTFFYENSAFKTVAYVLGTILLVTIIVLAVMYKFRGEVKVLMYTHFNWHPFDRLDDSDPTKIYDAFVSYSGHDHEWVWSALAEKLESHDPPYKLCIHDRDFELGAPIAENILNSVEQSKRTIMVLSRNFIRSEWCLLEFRAAHRRVLEERMRYLIVISLEDLNIDELDSEIQLYVRTNTYLSVDNKWFWQKLFYAMPQNQKRETESTKTRKENHRLVEEKNIAAAESVLELGIVNPRSDVTPVTDEEEVEQRCTR